MITQIDIFNFKALRAVSVPLGDYQLMIGPNGTGKSSVFDAILLLRDTMQVDSIEKAIEQLGPTSLKELTHCGDGGAIAISLLMEKEDWPALRYTVVIESREKEGTVISAEAVSLHKSGSKQVMDLPDSQTVTLDLFRNSDAAEKARLLYIHARGKRPGWERILYKNDKGSDSFVRINYEDPKKNWTTQTLLAGSKQLTLKYCPLEKGYEYASWVKELVLRSPVRIQLDIEAVRFSGSSSKSSLELSASGDNFANAVHEFRTSNAGLFKKWVRHVTTFFPEFDDIETEVRPDTQMRIVYAKREHIRIPHYLLSDGTLRFLALTLFAYSAVGTKIVLIEEPENGLHPKAIEGVLSAFRESVSGQQVVFASHSPIVLSHFELGDMIVFQKDHHGTELCRASDHPRVNEWREQVDKASLLAAGIL